MTITIRETHSIYFWSVRLYDDDGELVMDHSLRRSPTEGMHNVEARVRDLVQTLIDTGNLDAIWTEAELSELRL